LAVDPVIIASSDKSSTRVISLLIPQSLGEQACAKPAKRGLRPNEQLFPSIFDNAQIGISFFSVEGGEAFTNHAFQKMLGYSEEELSHLENWDRIVHPDDRAAGAKRFADLQKGKRDQDEWEQHFIQK
jgi:two-component system sensor histidine kinase/response regulator